MNLQSCHPPMMQNKFKTMSFHIFHERESLEKFYVHLSLFNNNFLSSSRRYYNFQPPSTTTTLPPSHFKSKSHWQCGNKWEQQSDLHSFIILIHSAWLEMYEIAIPSWRFECLCVMKSDKKASNSTTRIPKNYLKYYRIMISS